MFSCSCKSYKPLAVCLPSFKCFIISKAFNAHAICLHTIVFFNTNAFEILFADVKIKDKEECSPIHYTLSAKSVPDFTCMVKSLQQRYPKMHRKEHYNSMYSADIHYTAADWFTTLFCGQ